MIGRTDEPAEGVIKFSAAHRQELLDRRRHGDLAAELAGWRRVLIWCGLIGQDGARYDGAGFGNMSARIGPPSSGLGRRAMLITGTQTGGKPDVDIDDLCVVESYDIARNRVVSHGLTEPSSETMTHGAIYDLGTHIRAVVHVHAPAIWGRARALGIPATGADVPYGTPAMAHAMADLAQRGALAERQILAMAGHQDGVIAFGRSLDEAGGLVIKYLARASRP